MDTSILYFGYGANVSPEMMEAIVGRTPTGEPATLLDYELVIQQGSEISEDVLRVLDLGRSPEEVADFRTYAIRPKQGAVVQGMVWQLTKLERELVDNWEMNDGMWYQKTNVTIKIEYGDILATTEIMDNPNLAVAASLEPSLPVFLNQKQRMLEVATIVRQQYLAKHPR